MNQFGRRIGRYRFHDLIRLHARERAHAEIPNDIRNDAVASMLSGWLTLAEKAHWEMTYPAPIRGNAPRHPIDPALATQLVADPLAWFDAERLALLSAVRQACANGHHELAWELAATLNDFLSLRVIFWTTDVERLTALLNLNSGNSCPDRE